MKIKAILFAVFLCLFAKVVIAQRDPQKWPFDKTSIWNLPIHNNAVYAPSDISDAANFEVDEDVIIMTPNEPLMDVKTNNTGWSAGGNARCSNQGPALFAAPIPESFIFSNDIWHGSTPNSGAAILLPNGKIKQTQPFAKCSPTLSTSLYVWDENGCVLTDECIAGAHGGSHLSAIGGAIRAGELTAGIIKHVLKINLWGKENFYKGNGGYQWPASTADGNYNDVNAANYYGGANVAMRIGALLAIHKDANLQSVINNSLGLETEAALIIARALQNYGAYTVDNTAWDAYGLITEIGPGGRVSDEFLSLYGYDVNTYGNANTAWARDVKKLYANLYVITNNSATTIGGGDNADVVNRRAPLAPDFIPAQTFKIMPLGDSKTEGGGGVAQQASWRGYLRTKLIRQGYKVDYVGNRQNTALGDTIPADPDHAGQGGYTIGPDSNTFCATCETTGLFEHIQDYLPAADPDIVLLAIGVNDMFSASIHPANYAQTAPQRYKNLVYKIGQLLPTAKIILGTIEPVKWDVNWGSDANDNNLGALNAAIKALADSSTTDNIFFADIRTKMLVNYGDADFFDDLHLSEGGAKKAANAWFEAIVPVLNNTPNNVSPLCSISSPANNASFAAPANISLTVDVSDADGNVSKVAFYNGNEKIGESLTSPFSFTWSNVYDGTYLLSAVATDNLLASTASTPVTLQVTSTDAYVKFSGTGMGSPGSWQNNGFTFASALDSNLTTYFDAPVADGQWVGLNLGVERVVRKIRYSPRLSWAGRMKGAKIQGAGSADFSDAVDIYTITVQPVEGIYTTVRLNNANAYQYYRVLLPANAYGNVAEIEFWGFPAEQVNQPPTCILTTPFSSAIYSPNANIGLSATAGDIDGNIVKVEFFNGDSLIGTVTSSPFIFIWSGVAAGTYNIKAKATDNVSAVKTSNSVSIKVGPGSGGTQYVENFNTNTSAGWVADGGLWSGGNQKYESTDWNGTFTSIYNGGSFSNYAYQVDAVAIWNNDIGFVFNYNNPGNFYRLVINTNSRAAVLEKSINGVISNVASASFTGGGAGVSHAIYISNNGASTTVKINEVVVFNSVSTSELTGGKIGLYAFYCPSNFDNVVVSSSNSLPLVAFSAPATESWYSVGSNILFNSITSDEDGSLARVDFYHEDVLLGSSMQSPFSFTWLNAPAGKYNVSAIATDNAEGKRTSSAVRILVGADVLPVQLTAFTAYRNGVINLLSWATAQELNAANFIIERSSDGRNFISIGEVRAAGNSNTLRAYHFTDSRPNKGINFYRLRLVDRDDQFTLSDVRNVKNDRIPTLTIFPNPVMDVGKVFVNSDISVNGELIISDVSGKILYAKKVRAEQGVSNFNVNLIGLAKGTYLLKLGLTNGVIVKKIFKK